MNYRPAKEVAMQFFIQCDPPKATAQMKRMTMINGKPRFFKSKDAKAKETTFYSLLMPHQPAEPLTGPTRLRVMVTWPWRQGDLNSGPKRKRCEELGSVPNDTRPDLDNWIKDFQDALVTMRFLATDQQISELHLSKRFGADPGIYVEIGEAS